MNFIYTLVREYTGQLGVYGRAENSPYWVIAVGVILGIGVTV